MKIITFILVTVCFSICELDAQVLLSTAGRSSNSTTHNISWSMGEPMTGVYPGETEVVFVGFEQPFLFSVTGIETGSGPIEIFPNPVVSKLSIRLPAPSKFQFSTIEVFDLTGKIVDQTDQTANGLVELDAGNWPASVYIISIKLNNNRIVKYEVIKI